jgi:SPP1 gp7 family putative phage head morphogenesis protein
MECIKYLAIFLEKAASPIPVGRYDKNAPQSAVDKLFEILKRFQTKTAITIPKDIEVEFLEAKNTGEAFVKAIHLFNMFIGRSLFIPDLVGFTGSETGGGAYALGKEQMNLFFMHINRRRARLEAIINKEYVQPTVLWNFGFVKKYPRFRFKPLDDMKAVELAKVWLDAVKGKTFEANPEEINHFRKLVKFPEGDVLKPTPAPNPLTGEMPDGSDPEDAGDPESMDGDEGKDAIDEGKEAKAGREEAPGANREGPGSEKGAKGKPGNKASNFAKAYAYPDGDYHKKVNFKAIETKLNDYDESVMNDTRPVIKKMLRDLLDQVRRKRILETQNVERIDTLSLKYKAELKQTIKASFMQLFKDAQTQAAAEILKSDFARKGIASQKFLDVVEAETFQFVGDYEYGILKRVRTELIAAVKDGKALAAVEDILDRDLNKMTEVQIQRYARTKHTEVLNTARVEFFQDTGVVAGYQFSAILDDTTSHVCSGLNGKKFAAGDEPIPPLHFNCRSLLIPITKYEEFKPTESIGGKSPQEFIEENKGEGFSTK